MNGFSEAGLEAYGSVARSCVSDNTVPGLVSLIACRDQVHVETLGSATIGGAPMERTTRFRIASTSKPINAAVAMTLIAEGRFGLDDPVAELLPELAQPRVLRTVTSDLDDTVAVTGPITVRQLLNFTFGFGFADEMFTGTPAPIIAASNNLHLATLGPPAPDEQPDPDTWMAALGSLPLVAQPGQRWLYNTGASVLGVLCARAVGLPITEVFRTRILEPLEMLDTAFWAADPHRLPTVYAQSEDGLVVMDEPDGQYSHPPRFGDGAAGLVSTVDDLYAFASMLLSRGAGVLSPEAVREMTSDQLTAEQRAGGQGILLGRSWSFGQAVVIEGERLGTFGWDGGLGTSMLVDPARDLIMISLTQLMFENPTTPWIHRQLQAAAYAAIIG